MSHLDDESLAELALGGGDPAGAAHTEACADCRAELEALRDTIARLEGTGPVDQPLLTPPASVWNAIVAELDADEAASAPPAAAPPTTAPAAPAPLRSVPPAGDGSEEERPAPTAGSGAAESAPGADDLASRRERRTSWWAIGAAAAAGLVIGGVGVGATMLANDGGGDLQVVAQTGLTDLATEASAGEAILETREDGTQVLVIDTDVAELDDAYLEVWLIDESIEGMVSLGHLTSDSTEFEIPAGFDVAAFPIVDISVEPLDGVPTHSGDSVTRGVLEL
ncbi:anti-sigma factor [Demequina sp. NBRC 110056]|uniref:anti-sigma factor n=1 Tax=Demequina sp. NBRC 110056 TaxID=1570345 RepID=UPI000A0455F8|nr:anti-sigma factor [Demequina sp. NBRC 110056]